MPTLDFVADILCPWCFIARRQLEGAAHDLREQGVAIDWVWRPFELDPDAPTRGRDAHAHWQSRFGSLAAAERYHAGVAEAGRAVNIEFRYGHIRRIPHARDAHRLILLAQEQGLQGLIAESLAHAFFTCGRDIGDVDVLTDLAVASGLQLEMAREVLAGSRFDREVTQSDETAKRAGIRAVPGFCLHGKILTIRQIDELADTLLAADRALGRRF